MRNSRLCQGAKAFDEGKTAMRRGSPISSHPAFALLLALWFAALLGLAVLVLPAALLARMFAATGLADLSAAFGSPPVLAGRLAASAVAAIAGALLGLGIAAATRGGRLRDPRPIYAEADVIDDIAEPEQAARPPLRIREELEHGFAFSGGETIERQEEPVAASARRLHPDPAIRSSSPIAGDQGPRVPDFGRLLTRLDSALRDAERRGDPVRAFLQRQNIASPAPAAAPAPAPGEEQAIGEPVAPPGSPLEGPHRDHQAELRAVLDKLGRARNTGSDR